MSNNDNKLKDEEVKNVTGGNAIDLVSFPVKKYEYFCKVEDANVVDPSEIYRATGFEDHGDRTYIRGTMYYQNTGTTYRSSGMSGCFLYTEIAKANLSGKFTIG